MKNSDGHLLDDLDLTDQEAGNFDQTSKDRTVWIFVGIVSLVIFVILLGVIDHAIQKPTSPQALVAAAFNLPPLTAQEWKPGMGPQPLIYHPAGFQEPPLNNWSPLYLCPTHGASVTPQFDANGIPHCPTCNQLMVTNK